MRSSSAIQEFGVTADGTQVHRGILENETGMRVVILSFGGIIQRLEVPGNDGDTANVVLGYDELSSYEADEYYLGAIVGRCANRILDGSFTLGGVTYQLDRNDPFGTMHGGSASVDKRVWTMEAVDTPHACGLELTITSCDGDNGFPGNVTITARYELLRDANVLRLGFEATTDAPTIVNMTGHSYFNLAGEGSGSAGEHLLTVDADAYLPVTAELVPTGQFEQVDGTPFDFRAPRRISERIRTGHEQLRLGRGYDHNFVLRKPLDGSRFARAAHLVEPESGRALEVWTTEPGLDVYTGNFLDASVVGAGGRIYRQGDAIALEPEHFADSPNRPEFPSVELHPGEVYRSRTEYRFGTVGAGAAGVPA
ncbi:galactose mutarotase [Mycobacterium hackensackense]|uniref:aldose epimerase family protein n=1 Tax=Mycobacterium hackensackense TaxID=228909 RepID=UPI002265C9B5|nr:aldose epimerase family protein [Mycobacterium hackensackense]MCV7254321.1 galactose mutarotase [Mycobacterium hackensackense]